MKKIILFGLLGVVGVCSMGVKKIPFRMQNNTYDLSLHTCHIAEAGIRMYVRDITSSGNERSKIISHSINKIPVPDASGMIIYQDGKSSIYYHISQVQFVSYSLPFVP